MKHIFLFSLILTVTTILFPQEKVYDLDEIIVSAGRTPISVSNLSRSVIVLTRADIQKIPTNNLIDLLKFAGGVDLRARGTEGVQADVAIRGGSFEETLVMINGVKLSDPQTGHNNLNLPLNLDNVERIEILKGEGSRIFGANAFNGAINIITKKDPQNSINMFSIGGENGLYNLGFSTSLAAGAAANNFSISKNKSDGYRFNTNFESTNIYLSQNYSLHNTNINWLFGYTDKEFGANSFYSDLFPNQYERTLTKYGNVSAVYKLADVTFSSKIFLRTNFDDYKLDKFRPGWNQNTHRTNSYGAEFQASINTSAGITSAGIDLSKDDINSSNLGIHDRSKDGFFAEHNFSLYDNISITAGFFAYNYSSIGWKYWPGFDINYKFSPDAKLYLSAGNAFRIPTFTELYYVSPANMGNQYLQYEETTNYEIGFTLSKDFCRSSASIFFKDGKNLIDWVREAKTSPWQVQNVTNLKTIGFETDFDFNIKNIFSRSPLTQFKFSYTYLSSDRSASGFESKYLLDHLRHQVILNLSNELAFDIVQSWMGRFEQRINQSSNFIVDTKISKSIGSFNVFAQATNLFNQSYYDIAGVPLPGRWISAGIKFSVRDF